MTEKYLFADVEQPFHVWVKEGARWVLRDAGSDPRTEGGAPLLRKTGADGGPASLNPSSVA
jgi:hypothetical protein